MLLTCPGLKKLRLEQESVPLSPSCIWCKDGDRYLTESVGTDGARSIGIVSSCGGLEPLDQGQTPPELRAALVMIGSPGATGKG